MLEQGAFSSATTEDAEQQWQLQPRWRDARVQDDGWRAHGLRHSPRGPSGAIGSSFKNKNKLADLLSGLRDNLEGGAGDTMFFFVSAFAFI